MNLKTHDVPPHRVVEMSIVPPAEGGRRPSITYNPPAESFQFPRMANGERVTTGVVAFQLVSNPRNYVITGVEFSASDLLGSNGRACIASFSLVPGGAVVVLNFGDAENSQGLLRWRFSDSAGKPALVDNPDPQIGNDGEVD